MNEIVLQPTAITVRGDPSGLTARYAAIKQAAQEVLQEGIDYGVFPGTDKNVLLKPGAEKLTTLFGLRSTFTLEDKMEEWEKGRFYYRYRCTLLDPNGQPFANSEGSCNSLEKKYRWRYQDRTCPICKQATIIKGREEYGGGWLCYRKKGGCGAKFPDGDKQIEDQEVGQIENPEPYDLVNTIQKMAQKRALVAAVLVATGASEFFTQDLDDIVEGEYTEPTPKKQERQSQQPQQPQQRQPRPQPQSQPRQKPTDNGDGKKRRSWPAEHVQAVLLAELSENAHGVLSVLNRSNLTPSDAPDIVVEYFKQYREAKGDDGDTDDAIAVANAWWASEQAKMAEGE